MHNIPVKEDIANTSHGNIPTFLIKVVYTDNFSVQGYIRWIEEEKSVPFRSYMELLHLIEEGLYNSKAEMKMLRSWGLDEENGEGGENKAKYCEKCARI